MSRYGAQKHKLAKLLGADFNEALTEVENMYANNWFRFWDCGTLKVTL